MNRAAPTQSIGLQNFATAIMPHHMSRREKLIAIEKRLDQAVALYEADKTDGVKDRWYSDIYHLNKMLKTALIEVAQETLGVNHSFSMRGINAQYSQRSRSIYMAAKDKAEGDIKIQPFLSALYVLLAFSGDGLTTAVE